MGLIGKLLFLAIIVGVGFWAAPKVMDLAGSADTAFQAAKEGDWKTAFEDAWKGGAAEQPAELEEAWGIVDGGSVVGMELTFTIRDENVTLDVRDQVWTADGEGLLANTKILRDRDGSMANGTANAGDVWTVSIDLDSNWGPSHESRLVWYPENGDALAWLVEVPSKVRGDRVQLKL